jgi:hypothetical protein
MDTFISGVMLLMELSIRILNIIKGEVYYEIK